MKKSIAILMAVLIIFTLASCKNSTADNVQTTQPQTESITAEATEISQSDTSTSVYAEKTDSETISASATTAPSTELTVESIPAETDPAKWTDEEIVAFYKAAAIRSKTEVKSIQKMTLDEMVVNNGDGLLGALVEMITPFLVSALEKNSTEFDGITGGYENLELSDTQSVKAYKSGNYTVIEMTMKEQTDGIHADRYSGTVGHAISVVGDISEVEKELPQFKIGFDKADISLHYANPKLRVKINKDGIIEKGTWTYTVKVNVKNLRVDAVRIPLGATVDTAHGSVGYIITVGGGF